MARPSQRLKFRSAAEAREEAEQMEQLRDDEVSSHRQAGREAEADRAADRWNQEIGRVRAQARELDERAAAETPQPDVPLTAKETFGELPARKPSPRAGARRKTSRGDRAATGRSSSAFTRTVGSGFRRSGAQAQTSSWGDLAWQVTGLTLAIALLTLFVSSDRGVSAFGGLTMGLANGLGLIVDPVDPLAKGSVAGTVEASRTTAAPTIPVSAGRTMTSAAPRMV